MTTNRLLVLILMLLGACYQQQLPQETPEYSVTILSNRGPLVIVAPRQWDEALAPYITWKEYQGYLVQKIDASGYWEPEHLHQLLLGLRPEAVFLVGSVARVPTMYKCETWTVAFEKSCTYSDNWFTQDRDGFPVFAIGRLPANTVSEVDVYVKKFLRYQDRVSKHHGLVVYDSSPDMLKFGEYEADVLKAVSTGIKLDRGTVNSPDPGEGVVSMNGPILVQAMDKGLDFVEYFGHGSVSTWGGSISMDVLLWKNQIPTPLIYVVACETAMHAPNAPWYKYQSRDGEIIALIKPREGGPVPESEIPDPSPTQSESVLVENIGRKFILSPGGAMVYIAPTVVLSSRASLNWRFNTNLNAAYGTPKTIGQIWLETIRDKKPGEPVDSYQVFGDPTTDFRG